MSKRKKENNEQLKGLITVGVLVLLLIGLLFVSVGTANASQENDVYTLTTCTVLATIANKPVMAAKYKRLILPYMAEHRELVTYYTGFTQGVVKGYSVASNTPQVKVARLFLNSSCNQMVNHKVEVAPHKDFI